jgi:iron complex outermembrane receptor protein
LALRSVLRAFVCVSFLGSFMRKNRMALVMAIAYPFFSSAQSLSNAPSKEAGIVTIVSKQPTSLPTQIPATMEGTTAAQIEQNINASDSEDALKYLPSLLVRKRYNGDYNHAILSSRASGTGNSARSAVYADGILLSNYLGNGVSGLSFPPRWGMVTPEEIERVDVMYGPFSAAYPGNSVGAVVEYTTKMPEKLEGSVKVGYSHQPFDLYNTHATYGGWQSSASLGSRSGDWSWFLNLNHADSQGQPLTFATRTLGKGTVGNAGTAVTGAVPDLSSANEPWVILGTGTQYHTVQDHVKAKVAYDFSATVRATYSLGIWQNTSEGRPSSYLRNAAGQAVYSGTVNIDGRSYALNANNSADFALTNESLTHTLHGLSVKSRTQGVFDWEVNASMYDYGKDAKRQTASGNTLPSSETGGAGTVADGSGTGWNNLALRGTWRPQGPKGEHVLDFGVQQDNYKLRYLTSNIAGNWITDGAGSLASEVGGRTQLQSAYAQDSWRFAPLWRAVLGARAEHWSASQGLTRFSSSSSQTYPDRSESFISPKAVLSRQWGDDAFIKYAVGRAVRMPTVSELYGATSTNNSQYINDPNLRPEKSWTQELSYEKNLDKTQWRVTAFAEDTQDGIYSQSVIDPAAGNKTISRVQNVDRIQTRGLEGAFTVQGLGIAGLDLTGSVTYADSMIKANQGFVAVAGDTLGKMQPNIPKWRLTLLANYRWNAQWTSTVAVRYSGQQFRTLNNADANGYAYMGVSPFTTVDVRTRWQINPKWVAAFGIDNLNNDKYWNFHPYPQRSYTAELKANF